MTEFHEFDKKIINTIKESDEIMAKMIKSAVKYGHSIEELSKKLDLTETQINSIINNN